MLLVDVGGSQFEGKIGKTLCWRCRSPCCSVVWAPPRWACWTGDSQRPLFPPSFSFIAFLATEVSSCFPGKPDCMTGMWLLQLQKSKFSCHFAS